MTLSEAALEIEQFRDQVLFHTPNRGTGYLALGYYLALYDIKAHNRAADPNKISYNLLAVTPTTDEHLLRVEVYNGVNMANQDARILTII